MAREVATAETRRFGRSAAMLSIGRRVGRAPDLRLLLARLAQPRPDLVRRGRRPLVGGLRDDLDPLPPRRAAALANDRGPAGPRRADRRAAAGRRDDPARAGRSRSPRRRWRSGARSRTTCSPAATTLYWILVAAVLAFGASFFARGFLAGSRRFVLYGSLLLAESTARMSFALAVAVGIANGQTAVALGIVAAPVLSLDRGAARLRRARGEPARPRAARPGHATTGRSSRSPTAAASRPRCS